MITRAVAAVVGVLCALAVLVWSPGSAPAGGPDRVQPELSGPIGDLLRPARGTIWWVAPGCSVGRMTLPAARIVRGPSQHCHLWPSPSGRLALASQDDSESPRPPSSLALLGGRGLEPTFFVRGVRSDAVSAVSWSADGSVAAVCVSRGPARFIVIVHVSPLTASTSIVGRCPLTWSDLTLVTADDRRIYIGNRTLALSHFTGGRPLDYAVPAIANTPAGLAIVLQRRLPGEAGPGPAMLVTLDRGGNLLRLDPLPRGLIGGISVSPDGLWLVVTYEIGGRARLLPLGAPSLPSVVPAQARGYAFSPDGRFVAAAVEGGLWLVDLRKRDSTEFTNIDATSVAWTR
jgi:hypothetical protein